MLSYFGCYVAAQQSTFLTLSKCSAQLFLSNVTEQVSLPVEMNDYKKVACKWVIGYVILLQCFFLLCAQTQCNQDDIHGCLFNGSNVINLYCLDILKLAGVIH